MTMDFINRDGLYVKPKSPYVEWANSLDTDGPRYNPERHGGTIYLLEPEIPPGRIERHIRKICRQIFEQELFAWHTSVDDWPEKRTYQQFVQWFEVRYVPEVLDTAALPLQKDE